MHAKGLFFCTFSLDFTHICFFSILLLSFSNLTSLFYFISCFLFQTSNFQARVTDILGRVPQGYTPSPQENEASISDTAKCNEVQDSGEMQHSPCNRKEESEQMILNPFQEICPSEISSQKPPLFAIRLQNLFVYWDDFCLCLFAIGVRETLCYYYSLV